MNELIAALAIFSLLLEDAVHGASRAEVLTFVQQGGLYGCRRAVLESFFVEYQQDCGALGLTEGARRSRSLRWLSRLRRRIQRAPRPDVADRKKHGPPPGNRRRPRSQR